MPTFGSTGSRVEGAARDKGVQTVRKSLGLLTSRDRKRLIAVTIAQMSTGLLDLIGVALIGIVTALATSAVMGGATPTVVMQLVELFGITVEDSLRLAGVFALVAAAVLILKSAVNMFLTRRIMIFLAHRQAQVSSRLANCLLHRPLLRLQAQSSQESAYALTTAVNFAILIVLGQAVVAVSEIALLVILAVGMFLISPLVTVFALIFFVVVARFLQSFLSTRAGRLGVSAASQEVEGTTLIQEALSSHREIAVTRRQGEYVRRFEALRLENASVQADLLYVGLLPKYIFEIALVLGGGALAASQLLTKDLNAAISVIVVFLAAGSRIVPSMLRLQGAAITVRSVAGQARPAYDLADECSASAMQDSVPVVTSSGTSPEPGSEFVASVVVSDVHMTYPGSRLPALHGVSLTVLPGQSVALTGPTGSGKSTLADVILGLVPPDRGNVLVSGLPPKDAIVRWAGSIAYVPQATAMTAGSVRANVCLGLPDREIDDARVWEALDRVHLGDMLRHRRDGLDTLVGERGMQMSGGQRQRLGLARALYGRPRLLVLDEATSALDAETEEAIARTLKSLEGQVTTITVAHRLATVRDCDLLIYLEAGGIVASGTFDEVRLQSEAFDTQARLFGL